MARNRKKKAFYEVIGRGRSDLTYRGQVEKPHTSSDTERLGRTPLSSKLKPWSKGQRFFQLIGGRIEISIPYQLAAAVLLGFLLLILVAFRLGQSYGTGSAEPASSKILNERNIAGKTEKNTENPAASKNMALILMAAEPSQAVAAEKDEIPANTKANNRIVIQSCDARVHLEPLKEFFDENEIKTEIREVGGLYCLITTAGYENPDRKGTDGYAVKQRIIEIGAGYKAPPGYKTFGKKPFTDAYGMRFDD